MLRGEAVDIVDNREDGASKRKLHSCPLFSQLSHTGCLQSHYLRVSLMEELKSRPVVSIWKQVELFIDSCIVPHYMLSSLSSSIVLSEVLSYKKNRR